MATKWAVVFTHAGTGEEANRPETYKNREDAVRAAVAFNKANQDHTWNCVTADVVPACDTPKAVGREKAIDVTDTYRNPSTLAQATLRFYRERKFGAKRGHYVVAMTFAGDEPTYRFPKSIAAARDDWKEFLDRLRAQGYTERIDRRTVTTGERTRAAGRPGVRA